MEKIEAMLAETKADRQWFHERFIKTGNHGHSIEAAACAIREKALRDALNALGVAPSKEN